EIFEQDGSFDLILKYHPELFDTATIARLMAYYLQLAAGVSENPDRALDAYALLSQEEKTVLLEAQEPEEGTEPTCLHQFCERQAQRTPDKVAVVCGEAALTYAALDARSTTLAHYLQQQGVQPDSLVGISVERSLDMIVGLLGILKAGGAYVPLDPTYPRDR